MYISLNRKDDIRLVLRSIHNIHQSVFVSKMCLSVIFTLFRTSLFVYYIIKSVISDFTSLITINMESLRLSEIRLSTGWPQSILRRYLKVIEILLYGSRPSEQYIYICPQILEIDAKNPISSVVKYLPLVLNFILIAL